MRVELPLATPPQSSAPADHVVNPWLLSVALVWGLNTVVNKWLLGVMEPAGILAFRFAGCAIVVTAAARYLTRKRPPSGPRPWRVMALVGLWVGAQQLTFIYALDWTTASEAALLISIAPIWTAVIGVAFAGEIISTLNWLGILGAAGGVALIVLGGGDLDTHAPNRVYGDLWMVLSSLLYGGFMVYSKGAMKRYGSLRLLSWAYSVGALLVVPVGLRQFMAADWANFGPPAWGALVFSAFVSGAYGFVTWYYTISRTTATRTAVYQYLVPVVALIAAAVFLGERLACIQAVGGLIVIAGLVLARTSATVNRGP